MGEGIEGGVNDTHAIEVTELAGPTVAVATSCYEQCRQLRDEIDGVLDRAVDEQTDELTLVCEGKRLFRGCGATALRSGKLCSNISGPYFGLSNANEDTIVERAIKVNGQLATYEATKQVKR